MAENSGQPLSPTMIFSSWPAPKEDNSMDTLLAILQVSDEDPSRQKKVDLVQIMVVISSGILSSTTIATVVKAWLESRKTRLTLQIDGETKKLEYEGLYLSQEVSTI